MRTIDPTKKSADGFRSGPRTTDRVSGEGRVPLQDHYAWKKFSTNGETHCAIDSTGRLWGWGAAPVGDGTLLPRPEPVLISGDEWIDVSVGALPSLAQGTRIGDFGFTTPSNLTYVLALKKTDGSLWGWGSNFGGCLGNGKCADPVAVAARGVIASPIVAATLVNTSRQSTSTPSTSLVDGAVDISDQWRGGADLGASLTVYFTRPPQADGYHRQGERVFIREYGSGADLRSRWFLSMARTGMALTMPSGVSGYASVPTVRSYVTGANGALLALPSDSEAATFSVTAEFTVVGVDSITQSRPYIGPVSVVFSEGVEGDTAAGVAVVDQNGFVTGVTITDGGKYESPPSVSFHGTNGDATGDASSNGVIKSITTLSRGVYRVPHSDVRFLLEGEVLPGYQQYAFSPSIKAFWAAYVDGIDVVSGGSGYSVPSHRQLVAVLPPGPTPPSFEPLGTVVGVCHLGPSRVSSLEVQTDVSPPTPQDFAEVRDVYKTASEPLSLTLSPVLTTPSLLGSDNQPTASLRWPGTDRIVSLSVQPNYVTTVGGETFVQSWSITADGPVQDAYGDGLPYVFVAHPEAVSEPQGYPILTQNQTTAPAEFSDPLNTIASYAHLKIPLVSWNPGVKYYKKEGMGGSLDIVDEILGGHVVCHTSVKPLTTVQLAFRPATPTTPASLSSNRISCYYTITTIPPSASFVFPAVINQLPRGFDREPLRVSYAGGESGDEPVRVGSSFNEIATASRRVVSFAIEESGKGYTTEPSIIATNYDLAPALLDSSRGYSAVQAGAGHSMCCAISGGRIYEWGVDSLSSSLRPVPRGYKLEVTVPEVPAMVTSGTGGIFAPSYIIRQLNLACPPQTRLPSSAFGAGFVARSIAARLYFDTSYVAETSSFFAFHAAQISGPSGFLDFAIPAPLDYSREFVMSGGGLVFRSSQSVYIEEPDLSGLSFAATPRVLKPAEPVRSLHLTGTGSVLAVDANGESWVIEHLFGINAQVANEFLGEQTFIQKFDMSPHPAKIQTASLQWTVKQTLVNTGFFPSTFFVYELIHSTGGASWVDTESPVVWRDTYVRVAARPVGDYPAISVQANDAILFRSGEATWKQTAQFSIESGPGRFNFTSAPRTVTQISDTEWIITGAESLAENRYGNVTSTQSDAPLTAFAGFIAG